MQSFERHVRIAKEHKTKIITKREMVKSAMFKVKKSANVKVKYYEKEITVESFGKVLDYFLVKPPLTPTTNEYIKSFTEFQQRVYDNYELPVNSRHARLRIMRARRVFVEMDESLASMTI